MLPSEAPRFRWFPSGSRAVPGTNAAEWFPLHYLLVVERGNRCAQRQATRSETSSRQAGTTRTRCPALGTGNLAALAGRPGTTRTIGWRSRRSSAQPSATIQRARAKRHPRSDRTPRSGDFPRKTPDRRDRMCRLPGVDRSQLRTRNKHSTAICLFSLPAHRHHRRADREVARGRALADRGFRPVSDPNRAIQAPLPITSSGPSARPNPRSRDRPNLHKNLEFYSTDPRSRGRGGDRASGAPSPPTNPIAACAQRPAAGEPPCPH